MYIVRAQHYFILLRLSMLAVAEIMMCYQWERNELWVWSIGGLTLIGEN